LPLLFFNTTLTLFKFLLRKRLQPLPVLVFHGIGPLVAPLFFTTHLQIRKVSFIPHIVFAYGIDGLYFCFAMVAVVAAAF
jgi:hypothetical protein